jgi:hypothetical protein
MQKRMKKIIHPFVNMAIGSFILLAVSCEKEEDILKPTVSLILVSIESKTATFVVNYSDADYCAFHNGFASAGITDFDSGDTIAYTYRDTGRYTAYAIASNVGNYGETVKRERDEVLVNISEEK